MSRSLPAIHSADAPSCRRAEKVDGADDLAFGRGQGLLDADRVMFDIVQFEIEDAIQLVDVARAFEDVDRQTLARAHGGHLATRDPDAHPEAEAVVGPRPVQHVVVELLFLAPLDDDRAFGPTAQDHGAMFRQRRGRRAKEIALVVLRPGEVFEGEDDDIRLVRLEVLRGAGGIRRHPHIREIGLELLQDQPSVHGMVSGDQDAGEVVAGGRHVSRSSRRSSQSASQPGRFIAGAGRPMK